MHLVVTSYFSISSLCSSYNHYEIPEKQLILAHCKGEGGGEGGQTLDQEMVLGSGATVY